MFRAWVSFDNLLKPESAEKVIEKNMHRAVFAKAMNEMNIWRPMNFIAKTTEKVLMVENVRITRSKSRAISSDINTGQNEIPQQVLTASNSPNSARVTRSKSMKRKREEKDVQTIRVLRSRTINHTGH